MNKRVYDYPLTPEYPKYREGTFIPVDIPYFDPTICPDCAGKCTIAHQRTYPDGEGGSYQAIVLFTVWRCEVCIHSRRYFVRYQFDGYFQLHLADKERTNVETQGEYVGVTNIGYQPPPFNPFACPECNGSKYSWEHRGKWKRWFGGTVETHSVICPVCCGTGEAPR